MHTILHRPEILLWGFLLFFSNSSAAQTRFWHYQNRDLNENIFIYRSYERGDVLLLKFAEHYLDKASRKPRIEYRNIQSGIITGYRSGDSEITFKRVEIIDSSLTEWTRYRRDYRPVELGNRPHIDKILGIDTARSISISGFNTKKLSCSLRGFAEEYTLVASDSEYYCKSFDYWIAPGEFHAAGLNQFGIISIWSDNAIKAMPKILMDNLLRRNVTAVAKFCSFPLHVYTRRSGQRRSKMTKVRSVKEFVKRFDSIFTENLISALKTEFAESNGNLIVPAPGRPEKHLEIFSRNEQLISLRCADGKIKVWRLFN